MYIIMLIQEFHVLELRILMNIYDPRSFCHNYNDYYDNDDNNCTDDNDDDSCDDEIDNNDNDHDNDVNKREQYE